jgi:putative protein-disulfide isomerase
MKRTKQEKLSGAAHVVPLSCQAVAILHDLDPLTGQPFDEAYTDGLLRDTSVVFDSEPPISAMLAAQAFAGRGLDLLARLRTAHYVEGRRIADRATLEDLAQEAGVDRTAFAQALRDVEGESVQRHIAETRALMRRLGAQGFPTFALERAGSWRVVDLGPFIGQPAAWVDWLRRELPEAAADTTGAAAFQCGPDPCAA